MTEQELVQREIDRIGECRRHDFGAAEPCTCVDPRHAARALAGALRSVLDEHSKTVLSAATLDRSQRGDCSYCRERKDEPIRVYRGYLNDERSKRWMHDHEDPWPNCVTCADGYDGRLDWPCPTVQAVTDALAGDPR